MRVSGVDTVVHDDQVGPLPVHVPANSERLNGRVLFPAVAHLTGKVDGVLAPSVAVLALESAGRCISRLQLLEPGVGKSRLYRVEELLSQVLGLGNNDHTDVGVIADAIGRVIHRDSGGLGVLRRRIADNQVRFAGPVYLRRMQIAGLAPL